MGFKKIFNDIKTYLSINIKNERRFKNSRIDSYIHAGLQIGEWVTIKKNVLFTEKIVFVGNGTYIGNDSSIFNCLSIGNYCSISHGVKIGLDNHLLNVLSTSPLLYSIPINNDPTIIENDVLISANSLIMSGIKLGTGCVIGAGSFVNDNVPPYAIVAGSPAKIIRYRFDEETIQKLISSEWWNLDHERLQKEILKSNDPSTFLKNLRHDG